MLGLEVVKVLLELDKILLQFIHMLFMNNGITGTMEYTVTST